MKGASSNSSAKEPGGLTGLFSDQNRFKRERKASELEKSKPERKRQHEEVVSGTGDNNDQTAQKKQRKPRKSKQIGDDKNEPSITLTASSSGSTGDAAVDLEKEMKTIFVGNLPKTITQGALLELFTGAGKVESVRIRSVPVAGTAVDEAGNQNLVKKVCFNQKKFGTQKATVNAYVVFEEGKSVAEALRKDNSLYEGRHLRVDRATMSKFDTTRTVFLGGLPRYLDEEDLRKYFASALPLGENDIEAVRIVRDTETQLGKGFGYMLFRSSDGVLAALQLHGKVYKKRWPLRVTRCGKRTKKNTPKTKEPKAADDDKVNLKKMLGAKRRILAGAKKIAKKQKAHKRSR